jgi:hypothetical protein
MNTSSRSSETELLTRQSLHPLAVHRRIGEHCRLSGDTTWIPVWHHGSFTYLTRLEMILPVSNFEKSVIQPVLKVFLETCSFGQCRCKVSSITFPAIMFAIHEFDIRSANYLPSHDGNDRQESLIDIAGFATRLEARGTPWVDSNWSITTSEARADIG